jgi:hypothetical protein
MLLHRRQKNDTFHMGRLWEHVEWGDLMDLVLPFQRVQILPERTGIARHIQDFGNRMVHQEREGFGIDATAWGIDDKDVRTDAFLMQCR